MHKTAAILSYIYLSIPRNTGTAVLIPTVPASTVGISGYNQKYSKGKIMLGINLITGFRFDAQGRERLHRKRRVYSVAGPPPCPSKSESLQAPHWQAQAEFVFKFEAERHEPACRSTANALLWLACVLLCLMFYFSPLAVSYSSTKAQQDGVRWRRGLP